MGWAGNCWGLESSRQGEGEPERGWRILGKGLSWTKQVMLDARTRGGVKEKTTEVARYAAEVQYFEALPQGEGTQGEQGERTQERTRVNR